MLLNRTTHTLPRKKKKKTHFDSSSKNEKIHSESGKREGREEILNKNWEHPGRDDPSLIKALINRLISLSGQDMTTKIMQMEVTH